MTTEKLHNGQIYKAETLFAYRAILQWISGDRWMLLSEPEKGSEGHSVMCPLADPRTGTIIQSGKEMLERLEAHKWRLVPDLQVAVSLPTSITVESVVFRNFPGEFADVPSAFAFTADGKEWRLSEAEIVRALNAQPIHTV